MVFLIQIDELRLIFRMHIDLGGYERKCWAENGLASDLRTVIRPVIVPSPICSRKLISLGEARWREF